MISDFSTELLSGAIGQYLGPRAAAAVAVFLLGASWAVRKLYQQVHQHRATELTWLDLEARFKTLRERETAYLRGGGTNGRLDAMESTQNSGAPGWYLSGSTAEIRAEAERLFGIAGRRLASSTTALSPQQVSETNPFYRWMLFLVDVGQTSTVTKRTFLSTDGRQTESDQFWLMGVLDDAIAGCLEAIRREP